MLEGLKEDCLHSFISWNTGCGEEMKRTESEAGSLGWLCGIFSTQRNCSVGDQKEVGQDKVSGEGIVKFDSAKWDGGTQPIGEPWWLPDIRG